MNSLDRESKSMRVLHLIGSTGFYGAEAVVATLARTLPALGVETCVGHMRYAAARRSFRLEEHVDGCEVIPLEHERRMAFGFVVRSASAWCGNVCWSHAIRGRAPELPTGGACRRM